MQLNDTDHAEVAQVLGYLGLKA